MSVCLYCCEVVNLTNFRPHCDRSAFAEIERDDMVAIVSPTAFETAIHQCVALSLLACAKQLGDVVTGEVLVDRSLCQNIMRSVAVF